MLDNQSLFSIKIKNFQSLSEADLQLEDGLTIVTGATNNGKSAIVRAIETAVFNSGVDEYIKAGTDGLDIQLDNGTNRVAYHRKTKGRVDKTTYQFNDGEVQQKVGRGQLPEMERLFNIKEVKLQNNQKARLNFWFQGEAPFLMGVTSGQMYEFLSVSSSQKYLAALRSMLTDIKAEETEVKMLTASIDTIKREIVLKDEILLKNKGFLSLYSQLSLLKPKNDLLTKASSLSNSLLEVKKQSGITKDNLSKVIQQLDVIPMKVVTSDVTQVGKEYQKVVEYEKALSFVDNVAIQVATRKKLLKNVAFASDESNNQVIESKQNFDSVISLKLKVDDYIAKGKEVSSALLSLSSCKKKLDRLPKIELSSEGQTILQNHIFKVRDMSAWVDNRRKEVSELMAVAGQLKRSKNALSLLTERLKQSDEELHALKEEIGVCPLCGALLTDADHQHVN